MFSITKISSRGRHRLLIFSFALISVLVSLQTGMLSAFESFPAPEGERLSPEIQKKLNLASVQHELILLLIERQNFDKVELEWRKVLDLRLGAAYEGLIADSLLQVGYKLSEAKKLLLAQKLLDESLAAVPFSNGSKVDIFRFKAYLYKEAGDLDSAIKAFQQARELAEKP